MTSDERMNEQVPTRPPVRGHPVVVWSLIMEENTHSFNTDLLTHLMTTTNETQLMKLNQKQHQFISTNETQPIHLN